jgi:hypothetical protein
MPRDIPESAGARAASLAPVVPSHTVVSGLAGLWVRCGGPTPSVVDLVGTRGLHRAKPGADARGWLLAFHSGGAATGARTEIGGIVVASAERCAADALRWRDLATALPAVFLAIRDACVDPVAIEALVGADDPRGQGAARARHAWAALAAALRDEPPKGACAERRDAPSAPGGEFL